MISFLQGTIVDIKPTEAVIDVQGVGYSLTTALSVFEEASIGEVVKVYTHLFVREDQMRLFGFMSIRERDVFEILISVSGIGPVMALSIISGISLEELLSAVQSDDFSRLLKIPGIGKSKAEKILFELKRKEKALSKYVTVTQGKPSILSDAVEALASLGFENKPASVTIQGILKENPAATLEVCIKEALQRLSS
jgi:holliday junction DNA helicase RuvA